MQGGALIGGFFKRIVYRSGRSLLRALWALRGFRKIRAFGQDLRITGETDFPSYRRLRLPSGDCYSEIVRYADYVQLHAVCAYLSSLAPPITVVEVGAYHGAYAVILGKLLKERRGRLIAIEPDETSFQLLKENIRLNGLDDIVSCERVAISDHEGSLYFQSQGSQSHLVVSPTSDVSAVNATTLATILKRYNMTAVDLLLIDVEGAELFVLNGFPWKQVDVKKIFCELHPYAWPGYGYAGEDIKSFLEAHNLRCMDMFLREHRSFTETVYIGPTLIMPDNG
jgi:FkbM family methyltransferase